MSIPFLLLFLLPTQFAFHFWPSWAFVFGIRVDFLAPAIYLTDILALFLILTNLKIYKKCWRYLLALLAFAAINIFFSTSPPESVCRWLKIFEIAGVGIYFAKSNIDFQKTIRILFYTTIFFSAIGITQFVIGRNIGGPLYFLGERSFNLLTPGIALARISGQDFLRAYSTFSHPNSLAGFLGVILILLDVPKRNIYKLVGYSIIIACFVLTFSLAASVAILVALVLKYFFLEKKIFWRLVMFFLGLYFLVSLSIPIFSKNLSSYDSSFGQSYTQRIDLSFLAGRMISEKFLIGEGLNTFITNIPRFKGIHSYSWLLQPVHNIPLLVLSETGIFGLLILFFVLFKSLQKTEKGSNINLGLAILFIVITGMFDHYWFTLQQNLLLVSILLGLSFRIKGWKIH